LAFFFGCVVTTNEKTAKTFRQNVKEFDSTFVDKYIKLCTSERQKIILGEKINYDLFLGHQIRLSTYFRHLYHTIKYINLQPSDILSYRNKYEYITILRAQLSPQEQTLLFHQSLSTLGLAWEKKREADLDRQLITKYNLIRNILYIDERMIKYYPCVEFENWPMPDARKELEEQYK